jgi:addiction module HigA family antidote
MEESQIYPRTGRMHNPPHPGEVLKEMYLKPTKTSVTLLAEKLDVDRKTISRIVNGRHGVSAEMALRLGKLLGTTPDLWLHMQTGYDLWHAEQKHREVLEHITPLPHEGYENRVGI